MKKNRILPVRWRLTFSFTIMNALLRKIMRWKLRSINLTLAIFLILAFGYSYPQIRDISGSPQKLYRVLRVVDGDTLEIEGIGQVRLIGVDTPELYHPLKPVQYYAKEASEFVRNLVGQSMVRVEYDQEKTDKYGRTLAYVYLEDGRCLNEEIIKNGYGFAFTRFAFKSLIKYKTLEAQAGQKGLGLWANHGLDEFNWIIAQKTLRYEIFEMANNWWAVRYKDFIKLRLSAEELQKELNNLRQWTNEFSESDLERTLLDNGWLKVGR